MFSMAQDSTWRHKMEPRDLWDLVLSLSPNYCLPFTAVQSRMQDGLNQLTLLPLFKRCFLGSGKLAQRLRALVTFSGDPRSVPNTHLASQNWLLISVPRGFDTLIYMRAKYSYAQNSKTNKPKSFFIKRFIFIVCVKCFSLACTSEHHISALFQKGTEEGSWSFRAGVTGSGEPPCGCQEQTLKFLGEQQLPLLAELSSQPIFFLRWIHLFLCRWTSCLHSCPCLCAWCLRKSPQVVIHCWGCWDPTPGLLQESQRALD